MMVMILRCLPALPLLCTPVGAGEASPELTSRAVGAHVVPVGDVWLLLRQMKQDDGLCAKDGSHPAKRGNCLGARVFYSALCNETVGKRPGEIKGSDEIRDAATMAGLVTLPYPLRLNR